MDVSVVVPAYNEAHRIRPTLECLAEHLRAGGRPFEIVVVNDGSTDATAAVVEALSRAIPELVCHSLPMNRGKGGAVRAGMLRATGAVRVMCDADGSMPAGELPKLVDPVLAGAEEVVIGSRYVEGAQTDLAQPPWRRAWSRAARKLTQRRLRADVRDVHCGYKAFSARAAERIFAVAEIDGWPFDIEVLGLASRFGFRIKEQGIRWQDDADSRVDPARDFAKVVRDYLKLRETLKALDRAEAPFQPALRKVADDVALAARVAAAAADTTVPLIVHLCVSRRCNLSCGYCYEYDNASPQLPLETLKRRVDQLKRLRTVMVNLNGGEPLLHPEITELVASIKDEGMVPVMNSNGYLLTRELVRELGAAGLHALQISVDTVKPNAVTKKSLDPLTGKLELLKREAAFRVRINTVLGSGDPKEAVEVARAAKAMGFDAKVSFVRTPLGAMVPLTAEMRRAFEEIGALGNRSPLFLREDFMQELFRDGKRDWKCRSGARYFWVCEKGLVHFCESSYGDPGIPLAEYTVEHMTRHFGMKKSCSATCAVAYAHQASRLDDWRPQGEAPREVRKNSWTGMNAPDLPPFVPSASPKG